MAEHKFIQLIDINQIRKLLASHHALSGMAYGVFDNNENNLISVGWQEICVRFHRVHPLSCARCRESDAFIKGHLRKFDGEFLEYQCKNGMIDAAMPIIIDGLHLATFYTGQFFYDDAPPNVEYFRTQAELLGFTIDEYLDALSRVPVFSREHVRSNLLFLRDMVKVLAESGLKNLKLSQEVALRQQTQKRLTVLDFALNHVHEAAFLIDESARFHYVNDEACRVLEYTREELLRLTVSDVDPDFPMERWPGHWDNLTVCGSRTFEGRLRAKDGHIIPVEINANYFEFENRGYHLTLVRDITDRMTAQTLLEDERLLLETLIQALPDPVWLKDVNGVFLACNTAFGRLYNDSPSSIVGRKDNDYVDDDLAAFFRQKDREAIAVDVPRTNEEWVTYASDGHRALWETTKTRICDIHGRVVGALGVARDITVRKRLEEELRIKEQYQRAMLDNFPFMVWLKDTESRLLAVNQPYLETAGLPADAPYLGKTDLDLFPIEFAERYRAEDREVMRTGKKKIVEELVGFPDMLCWHETYKAPVLDADGELLGTVGFARDITERKLAEEALAVREREFRTLAENMPDVIVRYDRQCRRVYVNPAFERVNGLSPQEALGKTPIELSTILAPLAIDFTQHLKAVLETGVASQLDLVVAKDGIDSRWFVRLIPESDSSGEVVSALTIWTDITERKRMEEANRKLTETLESRLLALTQPIGDLSSIQFDDLFNIDELQRIQDAFAQATGVASIITDTQGRPITKPSNFCQLCEHIIRKTEKGLLNCISSDASLGRMHSEGAVIQRCLSGSLWDAGTSISVGDHHIANWLIGQILDESADEEAMLAYAGEIGANEEAFRNALKHVRRMPMQQFEKIADALYLIANQLSKLAIQNVQQARSITERTKMEEQLRLSEQQFRTLTENSPNIIIRYDHDCRRLYVNPAYEKETGIPVGQAVNITPGAQWRASMPVEEYKTKLRHVMETGIPASIFLEWPRLMDGYISSHAFHVVPEHNPEGIIIGCLAIGHNITDLKEAKLRLAKLAETSPGVMFNFLLKPDGSMHMPYVSPRIEELNGLRSEEMTADMSEAFARVHPHDLPYVLASIPESARALSPWHAEFRVMHPNRGEVWAEGRATPERQPDGGTLWHGFFHDITKRKRIEESLRIKQEQLAAMALELSLAEERERLRIASELHDHIGQTLLLGRIKLGALASWEVSEPVRKVIDEARDLLDQATNDAHSLTVQLNPPILAVAGLEAALEWLGRKMEEDYGLHVEFADDKSPKPLSDELCSIVYRCGRELLINAAKHAKTDRAWVMVGREGDMYLLAVEDRGVGFDPAALVPDMSEDCRFGLFSIQVKIERLGGRMIFDSTPGKGSRVEIRIPLSAR